MQSFARKLKRGNIITLTDKKDNTLVDENKNPIFFRKVKGGNGKLTRARRKSIPSKFLAIN